MAIEKIHRLIDFYEIVLVADHENSDSEATGVIFNQYSIDEFMEALASKWGMDWLQIIEIGKKNLEPIHPVGGVKRTGEKANRG